MGGIVCKTKVHAITDIFYVTDKICHNLIQNTYYKNRYLAILRTIDNKIDDKELIECSHGPAFCGFRSAKIKYVTSFIHG